MRFSNRCMSVSLTICSIAMTTGCVGPSVRRSAIRWNLQAQCHSDSRVHSKALQLASRRPQELGQLMDSECAPSPDELIGTWYGVNKGYGAAMAGLHQDVKVFERCAAGVSGYNILVEQVAVEDLSCKGWRAKIDPETGLPKTMGNFAVKVCANERGKPLVLLDYSLAKNPSLDPSRFLVDELVVIEPGLLLGRARVQVGLLNMPVAYFVLSKEVPHRTDCDSSCD